MTGTLWGNVSAPGPRQYGCHEVFVLTSRSYFPGNVVGGGRTAEHGGVKEEGPSLQQLRKHTSACKLGERRHTPTTRARASTLAGRPWARLLRCKHRPPVTPKNTAQQLKTQHHPTLANGKLATRKLRGLLEFHGGTIPTTPLLRLGGPPQRRRGERAHGDCPGPSQLCHTPSSASVNGT